MLSGLLIGQLFLLTPGIAQGSQNLPDLTIAQQNITISPASPIAGEVVTINATVWNVGTADAKNVNVGFYEEDNLIGTKNVDIPIYGTWTNHILDSEGSVGRHSSIAIDDQNGVHISYWDKTNIDLKYAYKLNNGSWTFNTVDFAGGLGEYSSIAVDSVGNIHIGYFATDEDLKYAFKPRGGNWTFQIIDSVGATGYFPTIAVDSANGVHIGYRDSTNILLKYAYKPSGGNWIIDKVEPQEGVGGYPSISIDNGDGVHMSYLDLYNQNLKYAYKPKNGNWTNYTVDSAGKVGHYSSIEVDDVNDVHISYYDDTTQDLKYTYKPNGGNWSNYTIDTPGDTGLETSIAIDNLYGVHISYRDNLDLNLKYAYKPKNGNWSINSVDTPGDVGMETSIAVDKSSGVHISHYDQGNENLKYASFIVPSGKIQTSLTWAPTTAGLRNITVKLDENNLIQELDETNNEATVNITVKPGPLSSIKVLPSQPTLELNETQQFNATGYDTYDNKVSIAPIWEISGGGTINQSGFFIAKYQGVWIVYANHSNISGIATVTVQINNTADTDSDGMLDWWEVEHNLDPFNPYDATLDLDLDSLTNLQEYLNDTDPLSSDTDGDNLGDGFELTFSKTDPTNWDTNSNGIGDGLEFLQNQGYLGSMQSLPNDWIGMTITWDNYTIFIKTSSSILEGEFEKENNKLTIKVSGPKGTKGETDIDVPKALCQPENISIKFDGDLLKYNLTQNATYYHIHIEYNHSIHELMADFSYSGIEPNGQIDDEPKDEDDFSSYFYIITLIIIVIIIIIILIVVIKTRNNKVTNDIPELPPQQLSTLLEAKRAKGEMTDETYNDIKSKLKKYQER